MAGQTVDERLLVILQQGLPIDARPFARIGEGLGLSEEAVLARVSSLFDSGVARRFGAVFESRNLGYLSTLCAVDVPAGDLEAAATRIAPHPGITHCYEREGHPNLWFTMTALEESLTRELDWVSKALGNYEVLNLPALQKFKIEAVFGREGQGTGRTHPRPLQGGEQTHPRPLQGGELDTSQAQGRDPLLGGVGVGSVLPLSEWERKVVRRLQASIAVSEDPFGVLAGDLGMDPAELLALLKRWEGQGIIRRIGLVLRHRQLGFSANSMCVWSAPAGRIKEAGAILARSPHVTHCYERPYTAAFPYNLYAMIHAKSREEAIGIFEQLGRDAGLSGGRMMWSVREFKKSSPVFFCEPPPVAGKPGPG